MRLAIPDPKSLLDRWRKFYRQLTAWARERMPKGLYARALIIIIAPMVLLQSVLTFVFLERHWETVTRRLSTATVQNIAMSFHGGLLGVVTAVYFFSRAKGINPLSLGDIASAATPFGLFFGRIANFINSEVVGRVSDVPWAMVFPGAGDAPRHPSQLYEAALEGVLLFIILAIATYRYKALTRPGTIFGLFLCFYGLFRSFVEFFREPHAGHPLDIGVLTPGIVYSIPMILLGLWLIRRAQMKPAIAP